MSAGRDFDFRHYTAAVHVVTRGNASGSISREALQSLLRDFLGGTGPQAAASILADAVGDLVASGEWSEADARTVLYTADRHIDRVAK